MTVPITLTNGVKIFLSGKFVALETNFGLRVRFDGNHHADVSLPSTYKGLLCGMCGKIQGTTQQNYLQFLFYRHVYIVNINVMINVHVIKGLKFSSC